MTEQQINGQCERNIEVFYNESYQAQSPEPSETLQSIGMIFLDCVSQDWEQCSTGSWYVALFWIIFIIFFVVPSYVLYLYRRLHSTWIKSKHFSLSLFSSHCLLLLLREKSFLELDVGFGNYVWSLPVVYDQSRLWASSMLALFFLRRSPLLLCYDFNLSSDRDVILPNRAQQNIGARFYVPANIQALSSTRWGEDC